MYKNGGKLNLKIELNEQDMLHHCLKEKDYYLI